MRLDENAPEIPAAHALHAAVKTTAGDRRRWHIVARQVIEAAPLLRGRTVLAFVNHLIDTKPARADKVTWEALMEASRDGMKRAVEGFMAVKGAEHPDVEAVRNHHGALAEIVDDLRKQRRE